MKRQAACFIICLLWSILYADQATNLYRGAGLFMNYCAGCHSLNYMRYQQLASDLAMTDVVTTSMTAAQAKHWFGSPPPDLSLIAGLRGTPWLKNFLNGFYLDDARPFGVNNVLLPNLAMPNVFSTLKDKKSGRHQQQIINDIVNLLDYVSEPDKMQRYRLGKFAIGYIALLLIFIVCYQKYR